MPVMQVATGIRRLPSVSLQRPRSTRSGRPGLLEAVRIEPGGPAIGRAGGRRLVGCQPGPEACTEDRQHRLSTEGKCDEQVPNG